MENIRMSAKYLKDNSYDMAPDDRDKLLSSVYNINPIYYAYYDNLSFKERGDILENLFNEKQIININEINYCVDNFITLNNQIFISCFISR